MSSIGNNELFLKTNYSRVTQLVNINHQTTGFTVAFLAVILTIYVQTYFERLSFPKKEPIIFLVTLAAVLELILWRLYAHYIDSSIVSCYEKIVKCEDWFQFSDKVKLKKSLLQNTWLDIWLDRGHTAIDVFTFIFTVVLSISYIQIFNKWSFFWLWIIIVLFTLIILLSVKLKKISRIFNLIDIPDCEIKKFDIIAKIQGFVFIFLCIIPLVMYFAIPMDRINDEGKLFFTIIPLFYFLILCIFFSIIITIPKKTQNLIQNYREYHCEEPHHAIIIAHKKTKNVNGLYPLNDYIDGIDILIERFRIPNTQINYKVYEIESKEELISIIFNKNATHIWLFGHGARNKLSFNEGNFCYYHLKGAPKKMFIGQFHCGSIFGKSFADYNNPLHRYVSDWPGFFPIIRIALSGKLSELGY